MTGSSIGRWAAMALVALVAALGLVACGGGGSDEDQIRTVVNHLADSDEAVCGELTDAFLKKQFKDKADCEKQAKDSDEKDSFDIKSVKVNGDKATVAVASKKDKGTIALVKDGGDWKIDAITQKSSSSSSSSSQSKDETAARGTADAFLAAVRDEDEQVFCGLLNESYARKLFKTRRFGIAECVKEMKGFDWAPLQQRVKGVSVKSVTVIGQSAVVELSNKHDVILKKVGNRYTITAVR